MKIGYVNLDDLAEVIVELVEVELQKQRVLFGDKDPIDNIYFNIRRLRRESRKEK